MRLGSLVKLREDLKQKSEHLYTDSSCWNGNESISHWNGIRCGDVGLAVELTSTTCRLVLPDGKSGWIRSFYLKELE